MAFNPLMLPRGVTSGILPGEHEPMLPTVEPFQWGAGGKRLTPESIDTQRRIASRLADYASDTSPIGHWTQGLARVVQGLRAGFRERRANKAEEANAKQSEAATRALMDQEVNPLEVIANPYVSPEARELAMLEYKRLNPAPAKPPEIVRLAEIANDPSQPEHIRQAAAGRVTAMNDPMTVVPLPGDRLPFVGRQSQLGPTLEGLMGGGVSGGLQPGAIDIDEDTGETYRFMGGDPSDQNNWELITGGGVGNGTGGF